MIHPVRRTLFGVNPWSEQSRMAEMVQSRRVAASGGQTFVILAVLCFTITGFIAGMQVGRQAAPRGPERQAAQVSGGGLLAALTQPAAAAENLDADPLEAFMEVFHHLQGKYVEEITDETRAKLAHGAIKGMLRELGDPYTRYMEPKDFGDFQEENHGQFPGIGAVLQIDPDTLKVQVTRVFDERPAARAGLQPGDYILEVNGEPTTDMTLDVAVQKIRGEAGTKVNLTIERVDPEQTARDEELIERQGGEPPAQRDPAAVRGEVFKVDVERAEIHIPVVEAELLDGGIAWVQLGGFNEESFRQLEASLREQKAKGMKGLVLDLRYNPGGMLDEAIKICSLFVRSGAVVHVQERGKAAEPLPALPQHFRDLEVPTVVLVNHYSASASEILAGALQDYKLATIVGETTYGKGLVQTVVPLSDNSAVAITTAKYLTPLKRDINKKGIEPDVVSEWTLTNEETLAHLQRKEHRQLWDPQLMKALEVLRQKMP